MVRGKKLGEEPKKLKNMPPGAEKVQCLEAIKELIYIINSKSKMIKEQSTKLQELEANLVQKNRSDKVEKGVIETKLAAIENLFKETQVKVSSLSQEAGLGQTKQLGVGQWPLLPPAHKSGCLLYPSTSTIPLNGTAKLVQNSPKINGQTIIIYIS